MGNLLEACEGLPEKDGASYCRFTKKQPAHFASRFPLLKMKKILKFLLLLRDYLSGNFAYQNYCERHKKNHPNEKILDKKTFLRDAQKAKWKKINRCC